MFCLATGCLLSTIFSVQATAIVLQDPVVSRDDDTKRLSICDHHVHLLSPHLVKHWKSLGVPFSHEDDYYSDVKRFLADESIDGFVLASMAYLYGSPYFEELEGITDNSIKWMAAENDFVAKLAREYPQKVIGFGSANPVIEGGLEEFKRCHEQLQLTGFKIHVQASAIDWLDEDHVAKLKILFEYTEKNSIPILLHFSMFDDDAAKDKAEKFMQNVLLPHPDQTLILAHMGGAAAYRQQNRDIINVFTSYLKTEEDLKKTRIYFELSAVLLPRASQGVEPPGEEMVAALKSDIETIGFERIVFGSDYPGFTPKEYAEHLLKTLPLDRSDIEMILKNRVVELFD